MVRSVLALVLLLPAVASAQEATLVLELESRLLEPEQIGMLSEELRAELAKVEDLRVFSAADVVQMIGVEQQKQLMGCDEAACFADLAGAMGAAKVVAGTIGEVDGRKLVQLRFIDSRAATILRRVSHVATSDLVDAVRAAARKLMAVPATVHLINQVDGAEVYVEDALIGTMPLKPFGVPEAGTISVRVGHVDYLPYETKMDVTPGKTTRHILRMHRFSDLEEGAAQRRLWAYSGFGVGGASIATGVALFVLASASHDRYQSADLRTTAQADLDANAREVRDFLIGAGMATTIGAALVSLATYLFLVNPDEEQLRIGLGDAAIALVPTDGGVHAGLVWTY